MNRFCKILFNGFDLRPRNKIGTFSMGSFSYGWMMDEGVGLVVGYSKGIEPGSYLCEERPDGLDLMHNDGAKVTAKEAKDMAKMARLIVSNQERLHQYFDTLSEDQRKRYQENKNHLYKLPVRKDFIEKVKNFADWAEKSGGFKVC